MAKTNYTPATRILHFRRSQLHARFHGCEGARGTRQLHARCISAGHSYTYSYTHYTCPSYTFFPPPL
jgi:hypothetical protein